MFQVLIVDNEESFAKSLARYLTLVVGEAEAPDGMEVAVATNLDKAKELMNTIQFDVAWVDMELTPDRVLLGGLDFALECKDKGICTVAMSSFEYALDEARKEAFFTYYDKRLGADEKVVNEVIRSVFLSLQGD